MGATIALRTFPSSMLEVCCYIAVNVKALKMSAKLTTSWNFDSRIGYRTLETNDYLLCCFGLDLANILPVTISLLLKEGHGSLET